MASEQSSKKRCRLQFGVIVFTAIPIAFILVDFLIFGRTFETFAPEVVFSYHHLAQEWFDLTPRLILWVPSIPAISISVIIHAIEKISSTGVDEFNLIGVCTYILMILFMSYYFRTANKTLNISILGWLLMSLGVFTMPYMMRSMGMYSPYYYVGLSMVFAGVIYCLVHKSGFTKHWNVLFFTFGGCTSLYYLLLLPCWVIVIVYVIQARVHGLANVIQRDAWLTKRPTLHKITAVSTLVLCTSLLGNLFNELYHFIRAHGEVGGAMRWVLVFAIIVGFSSSLWLTKGDLRKTVTISILAVIIQFCAFSISYSISDSFTSLLLAPNIIAIYPAILIAIPLWNQAWCRDLIAGPSGSYVLGILVFSHVYTPFLVDGAFMANYVYLDVTEPKETNVIGYFTRHSWNVISLVPFFVLFITLGNTLFRSRFAQGFDKNKLLSLAACCLLILANYYLAFDFLFADVVEKKVNYGEMSRLVMPILFFLPVVLYLSEQSGIFLKRLVQIGIAIPSLLGIHEFVTEAVPYYNVIIH